MNFNLGVTCFFLASPWLLAAPTESAFHGLHTPPPPKVLPTLTLPSTTRAVGLEAGASPAIVAPQRVSGSWQEDTSQEALWRKLEDRGEDTGATGRGWLDCAQANSVHP